MEELTIEYEIHGRTTTVSLRGSLDAGRSDYVQDAVAAARLMRPSGPVVVDLRRLDRVAPQAAVALIRETRNTAGSRRPVSVRGL